MTKIERLYSEYLCLPNHLFEVTALKELKLHKEFSSTLLVGAAIDSVSCAYEWEVSSVVVGWQGGAHAAAS